MSASETSTLQPNTPVPAAPHPSTTTSKVPSLGEGFQETTVRPASSSTESSDHEGAVGDTTDGLKTGKRRLFGFGKKKADDKAKGKKKDDVAPGLNGNSAPSTIAEPTARRALPKQAPPPLNHPYMLPASPHRNLFSSSPQIVSPAGSQIFERDVQESSVPVPNSPAIPSHIQTENHIPSVLDASSEAITNDKLDPDTVEIIMHSSHQPAAVAVTAATSNEPLGGNWGDELIIHPEKDEVVSNYANLGSADVRRLSFISFSDIVQSEHAEHAGGRDPTYVTGLSSWSSGHNRSPSPIRSPVSSQGLGTSPPTSKSASVKGVETSPRSRPLASPVLSTHPATATGGELTIETMTQALRRTASGDLSGVRSQQLSPNSPTEGFPDRLFR